MARGPPSGSASRTASTTYTTLRGEKIKLSKDKAEESFHRLLAHDERPPETHLRPTFARAADDFLTQSENANEPSTFVTYKRFLQSFCNHIGKSKKVPDLKPSDAASWLDARPTWGTSSQAIAVEKVKAALAYALAEGKTNHHPLQKVRLKTMVDPIV